MRKLSSYVKMFWVFYTILYAVYDLKNTFGRKLPKLAVVGKTQRENNNNKNNRKYSEVLQYRAVINISYYSFTVGGDF